MARTPLTDPTTSKSLLNRQLAGIADTLARASQRRDEEVRRALERGKERERFRCPILVSTANADTGVVVANAMEVLDEQGRESELGSGLDGADEEEIGGREEDKDDLVGEMAGKRGGRGSKTGTREVELAEERATGRVEEKEKGAAQPLYIDEEKRRRLDESFKRLMGEMCIREEKFSQGVEQGQLVQEQEHEIADEAVASVVELDEVLRRDAFEFRTTEAVRKADMAETQASNVSELSRTIESASPLDGHPLYWAEVDSRRDSTREPAAQNDDDEIKNDLRRMLADLDWSSSSTHTKAVVDHDDDPRQMLAELIKSSGSVALDIDASTISVSDDDDDDLKHLRVRLEQLRSPSDPPSSLPPSSTAVDATTTSSLPPTNPPPELLPFIIALHLEHSALPWPHVQKWTKVLFRSSPATHNAPDSTVDLDLDRARAVAHAEAKLQTLMTSELHTERTLRLEAEETLLHRRLVVSNLAAAVDEEEIERQFWSAKCDVANVSLLPRDPLQRTRTAWVDFTSRDAAVRASWVSGHVYGLMFNVQLAVAAGAE